MTTLVNIRIDEKDKKDFTELCSNLGLSVTAAFNLFVKQSIREQRIPVDLSLRSARRETIQAIEEASKGIGLSDAYNTVEELKNVLDAEDKDSKPV